jgi:hypothetical protein
MAFAVRVFAIVGASLLWVFPSFGQSTPAEDYAVAETAGAPASPEVALPEIVSRLREAQLRNHETGHPYTVIREYELSSNKPQPSSVTAEINFVPPDVKQYSIRSTQGGSSGERIVRRVLEHETELASSWKDSLLTQENYDFQLLGRAMLGDHDCFLLAITPRRDSKSLIRGRAWIDSGSFNVRRIEGAPDKNPSWWLKRLEITMDFAPVGDMWLQTAFTARADVRFFGEHTLAAHDIEYRAPAQSAAAGQSLPRHSPASMVGAGMLRVH